MPPQSPWKTRLLRKAAAAVVFIAGIFIGSAPASLHNHLVAREPVMLSAHSGINFWIGNNRFATGYPKMPPGIRASQEGLLKDSIKLAEATVGRPLTRSEVSIFWSEQARAYIRANFSDWLKLLGQKFINFWNAYQYDDISSIKLLRDQSVTWPGLRFGFVAALGLAGMLFAWRRCPKSRWIAAAIILHLCALMPVFVTERYRLAAVPGLLVFAAWWVATLWMNASARRWRMAVPMVGVAALAAWFVSIPRADASLWSLDHYKAGIRATETGDLERAERNLAAALAYAPESADIHFALGNIWLKRNDRQRAKDCYRRTLELNPRHDGVLNNLGVLALEEERWALAERFFAAGIEVEPDDAKSHFLLARAKLGGGDAAGARASLERALQMRPGQREFLELKEKLDRP